MIKYCDELKVFNLTGKNYSYVLYVNAGEFLQNIYYGVKLADTDLPFLVDYEGKRKAPDMTNINYDTYFDSMPSECGFYGHGDYREPTIIIDRQDGGKVSRFRYKDYLITEGAKEIEGMPHARYGGQTLSITLKDDFSPTEIILNYVVFDDSDIIARNCEIKNIGKQDLSLLKAFSFCCELPFDEYSILSLTGKWAQERNEEIYPLASGVTRLQSLKGMSSHNMNPFTSLLKKDCSEESGECYGFLLVYSGSYAITVERCYDSDIRIQGGVSDLAFSWNLSEGKIFIAPQALLCYSSQGLGQMSREYAHFIKEHIINKDKVYKTRPIVINNWEATYFDFNNEKLYPIIDKASEVGIDTFVLDDGWFGKRNDSSSSLGDWVVNEDKLKGGLKNIINYCHSKGLKFGLWFEPEMISENSDLYRLHPEFALHKEGVQPVRSRNQLVLDMTCKKVRDYIFNMVSSVLKENDISYVKWDMNRNVTECFSQFLKPNQMGEFMYRYTLGVYDLAHRLTCAFPNVLFEGCAGGGGRFDAGMLYYFPQIWTSDDTDGYMRTKIQWGTSICYPVSCMSCHVSVCPNHQSGRTTPLNTRGLISSLGSTGYELDLSKLDDDQLEEIKEQIISYKQISQLVLKGDLYRLSNPFKSNFFAQMLVSSDKTTAYFVGEQLRGTIRTNPQYIKLHGLDENKNYYITELDCVVSGKLLMSKGLAPNTSKDYQAWCYHITERKSYDKV